MSEIHVSLEGLDTQSGEQDAPLRHIQEAANRAQPGDRIVIHEGIYRESIDPPRGGDAEEQRITFCPAEGAKVSIRGSEELKGWLPLGDGMWQTSVNNDVFGDFNPFAELIRGHWFKDCGRDHHSSAVYIDGEWLDEADSLETVKKKSRGKRWYFAEVKEHSTEVFADFGDADPREHLIEMNVRETVFYPSKPSLNFITIKGLEVCHGATPWAPPTTEQKALIGTNWGKSWVIEDNHVHHSICTGIALGKYDDVEDKGDQPEVEFTEGEDTYHGTIRRALAHGWERDKVGHHIVRGNRVSHCEMAGIAGSLGCSFSTIENNVVHDVHSQRHFFGFEMAGIKFHGAIDTKIANNVVFNCYRGLWLDWMSQGTHVTRNIFYQNGNMHDLFMEVNHGPFIVDHNFFLSQANIQNWSEGGLYAHNFFAGVMDQAPVLDRFTPYQVEGGTEVVEFLDVQGGEDHILNNVFYQWFRHKRSPEYKGRQNHYRGSVYVECGSPMIGDVCDENNLISTFGSLFLDVKLHRDKIELSYSPLLAEAMGKHGVETVKTSELEDSAIANLPFKNSDGQHFEMSTDVQGLPRLSASATPGPFQIQEHGTASWKVEFPWST